MHYVDLINKTLDERNARIVGLGNTAFARVGLVGLVERLELVCIQESADLETMRKRVKVTTLEGDLGVKRIEKYNTSSLLEREETKKYLAGLENKLYGFIYKSSKAIERELGEMVNLNNVSRVRKKYEDKWEFRPIALKLGLKVPHGEQMMLVEMNEERFGQLQEKYGERLVFQLPDYTVGGGLGTFFVGSVDKLKWLQRRVKLIRSQGRELKKLNVTEYVQGESASMTGCVTRHGVLTSKLQRQLVDVEGAVDIKGRSGVFAGHEWGELYSDNLERQAREQVLKLGEYMKSCGYKGIFGVDMVVSEQSGEVWVIECNARYTGAFPIFTMLQIDSGETPMDVWHLLEFLDVDYTMDYEYAQNELQRVKEGAQLILHNLEHAWVRVGQQVRSGVYKLVEGKPVFVREGLFLHDLNVTTEFLLVDGVPYKDEKLKPGRRIGRIAFKTLITEDSQLNADTKKIVSGLYEQFGFEKITKPND